MSQKRILIRMIILIVVTALFISSFYFFFKNSRASSPLRDEEYMRRINQLSVRYQVAGSVSPSPTPAPDNKKVSFIQHIVDSFLNLFN